MNEELKNKVSEYIKLREEFTKLGKEIFEYTKSTFPAFLEYEEDSDYWAVHVDTNWLIIEYWDKCYAAPDYSDLEIPMDMILNNNWREYIAHNANKQIEAKSNQLLKSMSEICLEMDKNT